MIFYRYAKLERKFILRLLSLLSFLYVKRSKDSGFLKDSIERIIAKYLLRLDAKLPRSAFDLGEPDQVRSFVQRWARYLALLVNTPLVPSYKLLGVFRSYRITLDPAVERWFRECKPIVLCSYHRTDLPDIIASFAYWLARNPRFKNQRVVVVRQLSTGPREVIWSCVSDLMGIDLAILSSREAGFREHLRQEVDRGSLFVYLCDIAANRRSSAIEGRVMGLPVRLELGLIKFATRFDVSIAYLQCAGKDINVCAIECQASNPQERFQLAATELIHLMNEDAAQSEFNWAEWIDHIPLQAAEFRRGWRPGRGI